MPVLEYNINSDEVYVSWIVSQCLHEAPEAADVYPTIKPEGQRSSIDLELLDNVFHFPLFRVSCQVSIHAA